MYPMGLDREDSERLHKTLTGDHCMHVSVNMTDLDNNSLADYTTYFYDGQVTINSQSEITRSCGMTLFDPLSRISLDGVNPIEGSLYYDKMIQVRYFVWKPLTLDIFEIPVFRGPISEMNRNGPMVEITAMGKEMLGMGAIWSTKQYLRGTKKYDIIVDLLQNFAGETDLDLDYKDDVIAAPLVLPLEAQPFTEAKKIAASMGLQLFYDGNGTARMRQRPTSPVFEYRDGDGGTIRSKPSVKYDSSTLKNAVLVRGATPTGGSSPVSAYSMAPTTHPFNHLKLGRTRKNGTRAHRVLLEIIEDTNITTAAQAQRLSDIRLNEFLLQGVSVSMEVTCIPMLEEDDYVVAKVEGEYSVPFRAREYVIPLTIGPNATVNSLVNTKIKRR